MGLWFSNKPKDAFAKAAADATRLGGILLLGADLSAGVVVDRESAAEIAAVCYCVSTLARDVGQVPLHVYRYKSTEEGGGRERVNWTREGRLLRGGPNDYQTGQQWREQVVIQCATWGNHYARMARVDGYVDELYPVDDPSEVTTEIVGGRQVHTWRGQQYTSRDMLHIAGESPDGAVGRDFLTTHRQTLSLAAALMQYGGRWFANGASPRGFLVIPGGGDSKTNIAAAKAAFKQAYGGANLHDPAVFPKDTAWVPIDTDPEKAQAIGLKESVAQDIAALFGVPWWRVRQAQAPSADAWQGYVTYTLGPWLARLEAAVDKYLLPSDRYYCRANAAALLQRDILTRMQAYQIAIASRILSPNEVREMEERDGYTGGELYINPAVMDAATSAATLKAAGQPANGASDANPAA